MMTMPHPGVDAWRAAQLLFSTSDPTRDQCLAAVDLMGTLRAEGKLPASDTTAVVYPERPGAGVCMCGGAAQVRIDQVVAELFGGQPL